MVLVAGLAPHSVHPVAVELEDPGEAVLHGQHLLGLLLRQAGSLQRGTCNWSDLQWRKVTQAKSLMFWIKLSTCLQIVLFDYSNNNFAQKNTQKYFFLKEWDSKQILKHYL